jgi:hypothetical protein
VHLLDIIIVNRMNMHGNLSTKITKVSILKNLLPFKFPMSTIKTSNVAAATVVLIVFLLVLTKNVGA